MKRLLSSARAWLLLGLVGHVLLQLGPAIREVRETPSARDYASYHYAVQVAADGGDPYDVRALGRLSRKEGTRNTVQPYFYPPPFLLTQVWSLPLSLVDGYAVMLVLNELLLAGSLVLLVRGFGVGLPAVALLLCTFTPIPDNAWMGQANLIALFPALAGLVLARSRPWLGGILVGAAAMFKMSPALFLLYWAMRREWRPVVGAMATAVGLSLLSLPLVNLDAQLEFYREVLPGFGRGDYHGLTVPISLPANHSVPDLFARLWPGDTPTSMSDRALLASRVTSLLLVGVWAWRFRRRGDEPAALGALALLMTVLPVYTYEHHLVFLLLPVAVAAGAAPPWVFLPVYFFLAWPLEWLRAAQQALPPVGDLLRESKFLAELGVLAILLTARSSARSTDPDPPAPAPAPSGSPR